jgi:penicillin-binding protein 1A
LIFDIVFIYVVASNERGVYSRTDFTIGSHVLQLNFPYPAVSSARKKTAQTRKRRKPYREKAIIAFLFSVCGSLSLFLGLMLFVLDQLHIPDIRSVSNYQPPQTTLIYDRHGTVVEKIYRENRIVVPLDRMHPQVPNAFVAAEDGRFFEHPGLDFFSVFRAFVNNLKEGKKSQGGSTITQQVAKGLLLTPEKTYLRKFKEAILAWRIDTLLNKDEIIYIYLNHIYLGEGAYGIEAASRTYFNKSASTLSLAEVALLAGLPQAPSRYSPRDNWEKARARQRYVLNRMAADGYITEAEAQRAYLKKTTIVKRNTPAKQANGYYLQEVKKRAEQMLGGRLETAGLRIHTNLDQRLQLVGQETVAAGVKGLTGRNPAGVKKSGPPEGALVCIEPCTGQVRALVGGTSFSRTPFNRAVQSKRPAGSVFKPLVYAVALEKGWAPHTVVRDEPVSIGGGDGKPWQPKNFSGTYHGQVTLTEALVHSYNIPAIKVMQKTGIKPVHALAEQTGLSADLPNNLSLALGAADVSLLEMTGAYQPFVCGGTFNQPSLINRIDSSHGETLYTARFEPRRVMQKTTADQMKRMLSEVVVAGTGRGAAGLTGASGGKTGTSDENRDAWFIGFHNQYLGGIWFGHDRNQTLGPSENGGRTAAPAWRGFMEQAHRK